MEEDIIKRGLPDVDLPAYRTALGKMLLEDRSERLTAKAPRRKTWQVRRILVATVPAIAIGIAVVLGLTLVGPPINAQKALTNARKWYHAQKSEGVWEHMVMKIDTHANLFGKLGLHKYVFEGWHDSLTGNDKAIITDPKTGKTVETLIAIKDAAIAKNSGLHYYKVFSDKPIGEHSYVETTHPAEAGLDEGAILPYEGVGTGVGDGLGIVTSVLFLAAPAQGGTSRRECSPVESDIGGRLNLLDGKLLDGKLPDGQRKGFLNIDRYQTQYQVVGKEMIGEPGTRALVVKVINPPRLESGDPDKGIGFNSSIYLKPGSFAYLGASFSLIKNGKTEWTDGVVYNKFEFTDKAPDMSTSGMRQIGPVGFDFPPELEDQNPVPQNGMWPGRLSM